MTPRRRSVSWALALLVAAVSAPRSASAQRDSAAVGRIHALLDRGRLDEAEQVARRGGTTMEVTLGDILVMRGHLAAADSLYADAVSRRLPDRMAALAGRAELALRRGNAPAAVAMARQVRTAYAGGSGWRPDDMVAAGRADVVLGVVDPQALHDALAAFDDAAAADSSDIDAQIRGADLLVEKYNGPDARDTYRGVLARAPDAPLALLGLAQVAALDGQSDPVPDVRAALDRDPVLVPALVFLARLELGRAAYDSATALAGRALAVDSTAVEAWGILGAVAWLRGDSAGFRWARAGAGRVRNPSPDFLITVAEAAAAQRRYTEAVTLAREAVAADSLEPRALGVLASNELRVGAMTQGRSDLERAFARDPYNLWYLNTLNLLDSMRSYRTVRTAHFEIVAAPADAGYLRLYLEPLLEQAYQHYRVRYGWEPALPVRVELFHNHADFSVRTLGLTGLDDILGVSFGTVIALDAPPARSAGEYNYGSTAWHELAHTFTLGLSAHRVPRWLSEGLSVLEEQETGNGWGDAVSLGFLAAFKGGKLPHATAINDGLNQPAYPAEIGYSYFEASLVCRMIETEHGLAAIRVMLEDYARGRDTPGVLEDVFRMTPSAFDDHFDAWLRTRYALPLAAVDPSDGVKPPDGPYRRLVHSANDIANDDPDSARALLRRAEKLFPDYGGPDGAAWSLARLEQYEGDLRAEVAQLRVVTASEETALDANDLEATAQLRLGDSVAALESLQRLQWITPYTWRCISAPPISTTPSATSTPPSWSDGPCWRWPRPIGSTRGISWRARSTAAARWRRPAPKFSACSKRRRITSRRRNFCCRFTAAIPDRKGPRVTATPSTSELDRLDDAELAERLHHAGAEIGRELRKVIVGQQAVIEQALIALFGGGNCLVVGVPGLAKTLLIHTLARALDLSFSRIQFTPDLMPSDVTGTDMIQDDPATGHRRLSFLPGPIFANVVLADEINRTPPKTQAALLEAMQEKRVTVQGKTYQLDPPFFVFATQNPIELEGTYPLPEAQLDRFMFEVVMEYSPEDDEIDIVRSDHDRARRTRSCRWCRTRGDPRVPAGGAAGAGGRCGGALRGAAGADDAPRPGRPRLRYANGWPTVPACARPRRWCSAARRERCCRDGPT